MKLFRHWIIAVTSTTNALVEYIQIEEVPLG